MKYCVVYKAHRKDGYYLFIKEKDDFSAVPKPLLEQLGKLELAMVLPLTTAKSPLRITKADLITAIQNTGYYLQLPKKEDNMLHQHRQQLGLEAIPEQKER